MPEAEPNDDALGFERLLRENQGVVFRLACSVLGNAADAEEVAQEVFLRAYRKLGDLREPEKFRAWVARMSWRIALNRRRSLLRSLRRDHAWFGALPPAPDAETLAAGREREKRLQEEIERLPAKLRDALVLCAIEGLDARTVAAILDIPEGTVRSRVHLARRRILERLSP